MLRPCLLRTGWALQPTLPPIEVFAPTRAPPLTMALASPVVAGSSMAAALVLFLVARRWDGRLSFLLNMIFLFAGAPNFSAVTDDADPEMGAHVQKLRGRHEKGMAPLPSVDVDATEDLLLPRRPAGGTADTVPVRIYYPPPSIETADTPLPWLLYCHGGGWVMGSVETHDAFCRRLCASAGVAIASVDYRRAPEHKYPAPEDDCYHAFTTLLGSRQEGSSVVDTLRPLDCTRVGVGGDSSGGTLAANVAIRAARASTPLPLKLQLLFSPALDAAANTPSYETNANAPGLSAEAMRWLWARYLPSTAAGDAAGDAARATLAASPLQAADLSGVAPAYIVAAELDVLRDEAEVYAARLRGTGGQATFVETPGAVHAFCVYAGTPLALGDSAFDDAAAYLKFALR